MFNQNSLIMRRYLMLVVVSMLVVSCGSKQPVQEVSSEEIEEINAVPMDEISTKPIEEMGGPWYVTKLGDMEITPIDSQVYVTLDVEEMQLSAFAGCNQIGGMISQKNRSVGSLSIENSFSTQMVCDGDLYETALINAINDVRRYEFHGESLVFLNDSAEVIAEMVK